MKQICFLFYLILKRQLKRPAFFILLLLLPLGTFAAGRIPALSADPEICAGLYAADDDAVSVNSINLLIRTNGLVSFAIYDDPSLMTEDIITGKLDCGYIFSNDFTKKLDDGQKNIIQVIKGNDAGLVSALSNELVFSALFKVYGKNIIQDYLLTNPLLAEQADLLLPSIDAEYARFLESDTVFHVEFDSLSAGKSLENLETIKENSSVFPLRGILAILIFAAGLFGSLQYLRDRRNGTFLTMKPSCRLLAPFLYGLSLCMLIGISCIVTLLVGGICTNVLQELMKTFLYVLLVTFYSGFLALLLQKENLFASTIPLFLLASLIICPVFINMAPFLPAVRIIRLLLPPTFYIA